MNLPAIPTAWHLAVKFLCEEQTKLERLPVISGGVQPDTDQITMLCFQYASTGTWPALTESDRRSVVQRFEWARCLASTLAAEARKADGTRTVSVAFPAWEFEDMMIWFMVETWGLTKKVVELLANFPLQVEASPEPPASLN
jgi:hypothetical protein